MIILNIYDVKGRTSKTSNVIMRDGLIETERTTLMNFFAGLKLCLDARANECELLLQAAEKCASSPFSAELVRDLKEKMPLFRTCARDIAEEMQSMSSFITEFDYYKR